MSEKEIIKCAKRWWKNKRPVDWDEFEHLKHPCVNTKNDEEKVTFLMGKKQYREAQEYENNTYLIFVTGIETNSPEYLCVKADNNWLKPNKQKESLDTSFLSKKEDIASS